MGYHRIFSVRYKETLNLCSNKGIWKHQSYNGAEEALSQTRETVSMLPYKNATSPRKVWWLVNSGTPTQPVLLELAQVSAPWHCRGFLGSLQLLSSPEVPFFNTNPSTCPLRSTNKFPATEDREVQAGLCLQRVGTVMDWSPTEVASTMEKSKGTAGLL